MAALCMLCCVVFCFDVLLVVFFSGLFKTFIVLGVV